MSTDTVELKLLPTRHYAGVNGDDPIRFYSWPVLGKMYRRRVEMCLAQCRGGERVLEVGFGSGVTFLNLHEKYREIHGIDLTADINKVRRVFAERGIKTELCNGNVLEMPYADGMFDTVLLISILEHLQPSDQEKAFAEIRRVLKPGGQVIYGVPIERPLMVFLFRMLGKNIREHHFSTERQVAEAAEKTFERVNLAQLRGAAAGAVYEVGHFRKPS
jgi:ubiquinone/menaquinone biosynthesis C-methylase UbiE